MDRKSEMYKIQDFLNLNKEVKEKLLKIEDLKFLKLLTPLILLAYLNRRLDKVDDAIILTPFYISTIESLAHTKYGNLSKGKLVNLFLVNNLDFENKIKLLRNFIFTKEYEFRKGSIKNAYHLMRDEYIHSIDNVWEKPDDFCSTGENPECLCVIWLRKNGNRIDHYLQKLSDKFYQMRSAVFHDGSGVLWFHDFEKNGSLYDAFSTEGDNFISYGSGMNKNDFYPIIKTAFENFLYNL